MEKHVKKIAALLCACALACGHAPKSAPPSKTASAGARSSAAAPPPARDPRIAAEELSEETRGLLRAEGERLWTRWTTGAGPFTSGALAEHPRLAQRESLEAVAAAAAAARDPNNALALRLLHGELSTLAVARNAAVEIDALERARAALAFAAPGDARPERGERDLDRLLTEE